MAGINQVSFTSPYAADESAIAYRRKLAEMLAKDAIEPIQTNRMAGRFVVPISPWEGAAKLAKGIGSGLSQREAEDRQRELSSRRSQALAAALGGMPQSTQQAMPTDQEGTGSMDMSGVSGPPVQRINPTMQQNAAWLGSVQNAAPEALPIASAVLGMQQKQDAAAAAREQQALMQATLLADRAEGRNQQDATRRDLAADADRRARELAGAQDTLRRDLAAGQESLRRDLAAATRSAAATGRIPAGYRATPDGNLEAIPGGPADIKVQDALQKALAGSSDVDVSLATLRDSYDRLEQGGGITSTKNEGLGNVLPALRSSAVGQMGGKILGTKNQSARNDIAMARPALLAALMKATGMSAKQMDSNAELKLWISTATDPTLDVESNRKALDNIEKKYIKGRSGAAPRPQPGGNPQDAAALEWANANPNDPRAAAIKQRLGVR